MGYAFKSDSSPRPRSEAGYTLAETLVVLALIGLVSLIAMPVAGRLIRHSRGLGAFSTVRQVLATARLQAVKRGTNVVVEVSLTDEKSIRLRTFQDRANDTTNPLPLAEQTAAGNFRQDTFSPSSLNEPTLGEFTVAQGISVWKQGGTKNDLGEGAAFGIEGRPVVERGLVEGRYLQGHRQPRAAADRRPDDGRRCAEASPFLPARARRGVLPRLRE